MKNAGYVRPALMRFLATGLFAFCAISLYAQDHTRILADPVPGLYASPQTISFTKPAESRLLVSLDGAPFYEPDSPMLLSVPEGSERTFVVDVELRSLQPDSPVLSKERLTWRIDRKSPAVPAFVEKKTDGGRNLTISLSEPGKIAYRMFHAHSGSMAESVIPSGATLFLPEGTYFCAYGIDSAGNRGPAGTPGFSFNDTGLTPFRVINPVPGNWSNPQTLLIDSAPDTELYYSLDGSDPAVSGLAYGGPVVLPGEGVITLRVMARDGHGKSYGQQVLYSVASREPPSGLALPTDGSPVATGDFSEIQIPAGCFFAIGDSIATNEGGKSILFSAVRGTFRYYPLTVSNGNNLWRWVCVAGSPQTTQNAAETSVASAMENETVPVQMTVPAQNPVPDVSAPSITIIDWYYVAISYNAPVYYSTDGKNWVLYTVPFFTDRSTDRSFYWYSAAWKKAALQTVKLPAKPQLLGLPEKGISGTPVFVAVSGSPFTWYYEIGSEFSPLLPGTSSPQLTSGIVCEVPIGASSPFTTRFLAVYDGIVHGELDARFIVDRKAPRIPTIGLVPDSAYSRIPVRLTPSGEETIKVAIQPSLYSADGKSFLLAGDESRPVVYSIAMYALDAAGNVSPSVTRKVTVDLNAVYVDSAFEGSGLRDGSPSAPFANLDDALETIRGEGVWRVYLKGQPSLNRSHTIQSQVMVSGGNSRIEAGNEAALIVSGGSFSLSDCSISQKNADHSPVLLDIRNGKLNASNLTITRAGGESTILLRSINSTIVCDDSQFDLNGSDYALLFDIRNATKLTLTNGTFSAAAANASVVSLTASTADISDSTLTSSSGTAGRSLEAWNSRLSIVNLILERKTASGVNRDTAFWLDKNSRLDAESGITVKGFWRYKFVEGK